MKDTAVFGVVTRKDEKVAFYNSLISERLDGFPLPVFGMEIKEYAIETTHTLTVVRITNKLPPFYLVAVVPLAIYFFTGAFWLLLCSAVFASTIFFFSSTFYKLLYVAGLRREGYTGMAKRVPLVDVVRFLMHGARRRL